MRLEMEEDVNVLLLKSPSAIHAIDKRGIDRVSGNLAIALKSPGKKKRPDLRRPDYCRSLFSPRTLLFHVIPSGEG